MTNCSDDTKRLIKRSKLLIKELADEGCSIQEAKRISLYAGDQIEEIRRTINNEISESPLKGKL